MKQGDHWTIDEDLLREYVLEGTDGVKMKEQKKHLDSCPSCRQRLHEEELLVRGVRRHALMEQKKRLQALTGSATPAIPWPRIMSIAALLVIMAGIGIYNRWFFGVEQQPAVGTTVMEQEVREKDEITGSRRDEDARALELRDRQESVFPAAKSPPREAEGEANLAFTDERKSHEVPTSPTYSVEATRLGSPEQDPDHVAYNLAPSPESLRGDARKASENTAFRANVHSRERIIVLHRITGGDAPESSDRLTVTIGTSHDTLHVTIPVTNPDIPVSVVSSGDSLRIRTGETEWGLPIPEQLLHEDGTERPGPEKP